MLNVMIMLIWWNAVQRWDVIEQYRGVIRGRAGGTYVWACCKRMHLRIILSLCFNVHFTGGPGLASTRLSPFWILLELRGDGDGGNNWRVVTNHLHHPYKMCKARQIVTINKPTPSFLQAGCPSCRPTNRVRAVNGKSKKKWRRKIKAANG